MISTRALTFYLSCQMEQCGHSGKVIQLAYIIVELVPPDEFIPLNEIKTRTRAYMHLVKIQSKNK